MRGTIQSLIRRLRLLLSQVRDADWSLAAAFALIALALGVIGFAHLVPQAQRWSLQSVLSYFYLTLGLFGLNNGAVEGDIPLALQIARFLAPAVTVLALVKGYAVLAGRSLNELKIAAMSDHTVVCGLGQQGLAIALELAARGEAVAAIDISEARSDSQGMTQAKIPAVIGDATDPEVLKRAGVDRARRLVAVCGRDELNAEVARVAIGESAEGSERLSCFVHVSDLGLCRHLESVTMPGWTSTGHVDFFSSFESTAAALLNQFDPFASVQEGGQACIGMLGIDQLAETLLVHLAKRAQLERAPGSPRPIVVLIAAGAKQWWSVTSGIYRGIDSLIDVRAIESGEDDRSVQLLDFADIGLTSAALDIAFVTTPEDSTTVKAALALAAGPLSETSTVVACLSDSRGFGALIDNSYSACMSRGLRFFSWTDGIKEPRFVFHGSDESLARALHQAYLRTRLAQSDSMGSDSSMRPWSELDDSLREQNVAAVHSIEQELRSANIHLVSLMSWTPSAFQFTAEELETIAATEHNRWLAGKRASGWTYADHPKDEASKSGWHITEWESLDATKAHDDARRPTYQFVESIPSVVARAGFRLERVTPTSRD